MIKNITGSYGGSNASFTAFENKTQIKRTFPRI